MQHRHFAQRLKTALESADSPSVTISSPNGGTEVIATGVVPYYAEDELMAARDTADEIEAVVEEGDALHDAKVQLESLNAILGSVNCPLAPYEVRCTALALEAIANRWGGESIPMPAMEAFTNPSSSHQAVISLEANVKKVAKQIIDYLKELWEKFKALVKKFMDHFVKAFNGGRKKAEVLIRKIDEGKFPASQSNKKIDINEWASAVTVDGRIMTIAQLSEWVSAITVDGKIMTIAQLVELGKTLATLFKDTFGTLAEPGSQSSFSSLFKLLGTARDANFGEITEEFNKRLAEASSSSKIFSLSSNTETVCYPGNKYYILDPPKANGVRMGSLHTKEKNDSQLVTIIPFTEEEVKKIVASYQEATRHIDSIMSQYEGFDRMVEETLRSVASNVNKTPDSDFAYKVTSMWQAVDSLTLNRSRMTLAIMGSVKKAYMAFLDISFRSSEG